MRISGELESRRVYELSWTYVVWWIIVFLGRHLMTSAVILVCSNPGDLLSGYLLMANLTSFGVKCFTGWQTGNGGNNKLVHRIYEVRWEYEWGLKISDRWCLNNSDLTESEIAKLPSGFLIGTFGALVLHMFLVVLQRLPLFGERFLKKLSKDFDLCLASNFLRLLASLLEIVLCEGILVCW